MLHSWSDSESRLQKLLKIPQLQKFFELEEQREANLFSRWEEFYTSARAIRNKGSRDGHLKKRAKGEPVDLFNASHTTLNEIFEKIEKEEPYNFPKDGDPTLQAACEALSHALQKASTAKAEHYTPEMEYETPEMEYDTPEMEYDTPEMEHDTPEIKQALDNLRKAYDEAAESNTVSMRYIDVEPLYSPLSPLKRTASLKRTLLARSWIKELITKVHDRSLGPQILVVGKPGSGESLDLPCL